MKTWVALFVKEWKDSRYLLAFLVITLVALQIYGWYNFEPPWFKGKEGGWRAIPFVLGFVTCIISPPFLLARSFSSEFRSETHYQWFSLPVKRRVTVLCKYAVALSNGFLLWLIAAGSIALLVFVHLIDEGKWAMLMTSLSMISYGEILEKTFLFLVDLCVVFIAPALLYMMLLLALVTVMEGVKFSVNRFQGLAALVSFGGAVYLYARFYKMVVGWLSFLGRYDTVGFWVEGPMEGVIKWSHLAYPSLALALLLIIGLWLFEKRVEV